MKHPIRIKVRDKEFVIDFVNNWFCYNYYEFRQLTNQAEIDYIRCTEIQNEVKANKIDPKIAAAEFNKIAGRLKAIGSVEFFNKRLDLIKEALVSNGQEFSKEWRERKASPKDILYFLDEVYKYEVGDGGKKKAGQTSK